MRTTRAYPDPSRCMDCGATPTRWVRFWANGMRYRVCKDHAREYRSVCNTNIDPRTGDPIRERVTINGGAK